MVVEVEFGKIPWTRWRLAWLIGTPLISMALCGWRSGFGVSGFALGLVMAAPVIPFAIPVRHRPTVVTEEERERRRRWLAEAEVRPQGNDQVPDDVRTAAAAAGLGPYVRSWTEAKPGRGRTAPREGWLYHNGFLFRHSHDSSLVAHRWLDTVVWRKISNNERSVADRYTGRPLSMSYLYWVTGSDGQNPYAWSYGLSDREIFVIGETVERRVCAVKVPVALARIRAGGRSEHGPVSVDALGITVDGNTLGWASVESVAAESDALQIQERDSTGDWQIIPAQDIPDLAVLVALTDQLRGKSRDAAHYCAPPPESAGVAARQRGNAVGTSSLVIGGLFALVAASFLGMGGDALAAPSIGWGVGLIVCWSERYWGRGRAASKWPVTVAWMVFLVSLVIGYLMT